MSNYLNLKSSLFSFGALISGYSAVFVLLHVLYLVEQPDLGLLGRVIVYGTLLEELMKFVLAYAIYHYSGLPLVAIFVGLGYGLGEQSLYLYSYGEITFKVIVMHTLSGASSAYFLSKYKFLGMKRYLKLALLAPVIVHSMYNLSIWFWLQWTLFSI